MTREERIAAEVAELFGSFSDAQDARLDERLQRWASQRLLSARDRWHERYGPQRVYRQKLAGIERAKELLHPVACAACLRWFVRSDRRQLTCCGSCAAQRWRMLDRLRKGWETADERVARMTLDVRWREKMRVRRAVKRPRNVLLRSAPLDARGDGGA